MKPRTLRMLLIVGGLAAVSGASALVLNALNSNVAFFYSPTQVGAGEAPSNRVFRIGGLVKPGSIVRQQMTVRFVVTDTAHDIPVHYTGILPDLFREGKGAVVQGRLVNGPDGHFAATEVLAKHDENYMPPEAQHALDQAHKQTNKGKAMTGASR
jgi:cytochrome c-type biogenesis protein CcmE